MSGSGGWVGKWMANAWMTQCVGVDGAWIIEDGWIEDRKDDWKGWVSGLVGGRVDR